MKIDVVFSGGGVKAFAFIGALQSIAVKKMQVERVAGTSAGAIIAALVAAGYRPDELERMITELNLRNFLDAPFLSKRLPFTKWLYLYFNMGMYKGDAFEKWLNDLLCAKGVKTFADLPTDYLKIIVSDISLGKLIVIPDDLKRVYGINPETFNVATAVRMSASFPYLFIPKVMKGAQDKPSIMLDGGLLSNFPLWIFKGKEKAIRPVIGITLSDSLENINAQKINNAIDMLHALFQTMLIAHDARYISKSKQANIIFIPVKKVTTTNLKLSQADKQALIELGALKTIDYLKTWP